MIEEEEDEGDREEWWKQSFREEKNEKLNLSVKTIVVGLQSCASPILASLKVPANVSQKTFPRKFLLPKNSGG